MSSVVLLGATGATGKRILQELLQESSVAKVTTFTRSKLKEESPKLNQIIVENFDNLESTPVEAWSGDVIVNALGTTRAIAGGGQEFVRVERDFSQHAMAMAKKAGVRRSITLSAVGANANVPGPLWFHPLLYTKTLGEKENAAMGFDQVVIFQPGMLDREVERAEEPWFARLPFLAKLKVSVYAKAVLHAVKQKDFAAPVTRITGNADITKYAQSGSSL